MAKKAKHDDEILNEDLLDEHEDAGDAGGALVARVKPDGMAALLADGFAVEKVVSLKQGDMLRGTLLGPGGPLQVIDPVTGELRPIGTWRVQVAPGAIAILKTSAKLDASLPALTGHEIAIVRGGTERSSRGRNVTDYTVLAK